MHYSFANKINTQIKDTNVVTHKPQSFFTRESIYNKAVPNIPAMR